MPPQLTEQERVPACLLTQHVGQGDHIVDASTGQLCHEFDQFGLLQAGQPKPGHPVGAAQVGQRVQDRGGEVGGGVAVAADKQQPRVRGDADQVPHQQHRGPVGPMQVVEDQHQRTAAGHVDQQARNRCVEPVPRGLRVRARRRRDRETAGGEVGEQPNQLSTHRLEVGGEGGRIGVPEQVVEGLDHRLVGHCQLGVTDAV